MAVKAAKQATTESLEALLHDMENCPLASRWHSRACDHCPILGACRTLFDLLCAADLEGRPPSEEAVAKFRSWWETTVGIVMARKAAVRQITSGGRRATGRSQPRG